MTSEFDFFDDVDTHGYFTIDAIIGHGHVLYEAMIEVGKSMNDFDPEFVHQHSIKLISRSLTTMSEVAYNLRELCRLYRTHPDMDFEHDEVTHAWVDVGSWPVSATTTGWLPIHSDSGAETVEEVLRHNTRQCVQTIGECAEIAAEYIDSVGGWYDSVDVDAAVKTLDHNVMHLLSLVLDTVALWQAEVFDAHAALARSMQAPRPPGWEKLLDPQPYAGSNRTRGNLQ
jgi:hypothetical protein